MQRERVQRRLTTVLAADVVGFSRLIRADEETTLSALNTLRAEVFSPVIADRGGRIFKLMGDGILAEFPSAVEAVRAAAEIQNELRRRTAGSAQGRIEFRIGVHLGDVVVDGDDLQGDGINLASRLEGLAEAGGLCISGPVYDQVRDRVDLRFEDLGEQSLKNIERPVRAWRWAGDGSRAKAQPGAVPPVREKPSIAVLPFTNRSGDAAQDFLADGIAEDTATALSRLRWLLVIARSSTAVYRGHAVDVREVARELGVRYVLEGSVRTSGNRLRVTGQLVDAESGKNIWAHRYDRDLHDIFAVQDEITAQVVAAVEPHLYVEEGSRALRQPDSIDAWGLVVRAIDLIHRVDRSRNEDARALLRRAISLEPSYARAHALLGWAIWWAALCDWIPDRQEAHREAAALAREALFLDQNDPWARMVSGLSLSTAGHHDRALDELSAALAINPSFALGHSIFGWALLRAGQFDEAIEETGRALRLSPLDSFSGIYTSTHGLALLGARRFEEALPFLRRSVAAFTDYTGHYNTLISCCGHLGLQGEAREFIAMREKIGPPLRLSVVRRNLANFAHRDVFVEGLAKAGIPE